jgi:hypothetical protein
MDGSSPGNRRVLVVQRRWQSTRLAREFQADAYRLAAPPRSVTIAAAARDTGGIEVQKMPGRVTAGGRS